MSSFYTAEKWKEWLIRKSHNTEIAVSVDDVFLQESHTVWFFVSHLIPGMQDEQLRGGPDEACGGTRLGSKALLFYRSI